MVDRTENGQAAAAPAKSVTMDALLSEADKALDEVVAELRGLRRGHAKDGTPVSGDDAVWRALKVILGVAHIARAEVALMRSRHADLAGIVLQGAKTLEEVAGSIASGAGARLEVRYTPNRHGPTTLPTTHVVQGEPR